MGIILFLFVRINSLENDIVWIRAVPDIRLTNIQYEHKGLHLVRISGFVKFDDNEKQPKNIRQYYRISTEIDYEGLDVERKFYLEEVLSSRYLPPEILGKIRLKSISEDESELVLEDEFNNRYIIYKNSDFVSLLDVNDDKSTLITSDREFSNFIRQLYGKKPLY